MLTAETKRRLDACRDILVGKLPLPTDQIELITLALIYKFMDDLDEESVKLGGKRSFFVGPLEEYRWRALLPQTASADKRMNLFAEGIEAIGKAEHLPALFRDIFRNSFLKFRDGRILTLFLNEVSAFEYSHSEELGNAFEYLLKTMGIQAENGQFRTPRHIIDFMVACLDPQPSDRILDPACGTGGFLVSCYKHILAQHTSPGSAIAGDKLTHDQRQKVYSNLAGYDVTDLMVKLSKVNLFLHGFPDPAIHIYDTLTNDTRWNEKADLILANPPFMTPKGGVSPHTKFRVAAKKSEVLFTDYIAEHLTPDGRGGVIVPNGIVATTQNAYVKLRKFLVEDSLVAVVSLPAGVFNPYSGVKTSILFLDKKLARKTDKILFLKITAEGFDLGAQRRPILENDLPEAERLVSAWFIGKFDSASGTRLASKTIEKAILLENRACSLQAEIFFGEKVVATSVEMVSLGDIATFNSGGTPSKANSEFWRGDIPWVSPKDMKSLVIIDTEDHLSAAAIESSATKLLAPKTVLCVVRSGILQHTLPVAITARPMCTNQDILAITPDKTRLDAKFLMFLLKGRSADILRDGIKTGVTVQSFHNGFFKTFEIPLPPLEEQRRVVAEIESYRKVIDGARQILETYQPVIDPEPDWPLLALGEVCKAILTGPFGSSLHESDYIENGIPVVNPKNIVNGVVVADATKTISSQTRERLKDFELRAGDVLIGRRGEMGRCAVITNEMEGWLCGTGCFVLRLKESFSPRFVSVLLSSPKVKAHLEQMAIGVTLKNLNQEILSAVEIPLPDLQDQRRIVAELDAEAAQVEITRALVTRFEAKIQRLLDRLWGTSAGEAGLNAAA
jgi:type I restriction enzyme M protein